MTTFSGQRERAQYNQEMIEVQSLVKLARNYAYTNRSTYDGVNTIVPEQGYGIYFERSNTPGQSKLILFANTSAANDETRLQYDDAGTDPDIIEEELILSQDAIMEAITLTENGPPAVDTVVDRGLILFEITTAEVSLYNNGDPSNIVALPTEYDDLAVDFLRLSDDADNSRKTFSINKISGVPKMSL